MHKRLITDGGIVSTPPRTPGTSWNSMELWSQLTVIYRCWVRSTWKQMSQSTLGWSWEACATEAANPLSLHQAQLCLTIFSKWRLLKEGCALTLGGLMPYILCLGMSLSVCKWMAGLLVRPWGVSSSPGNWGGKEISSPMYVTGVRFVSSWKKTLGLHWIIGGWTAG